MTSKKHDPEETVAKLRQEIFHLLREAKVDVESWGRHYDTVRLHGSIDGKLPA